MTLVQEGSDEESQFSSPDSHRQVHGVASTKDISKECFCCGVRGWVDCAVWPERGTPRRHGLSPHGLSPHGLSPHGLRYARTPAAPPAMVASLDLGERTPAPVAMVASLDLDERTVVLCGGIASGVSVR